MRRQDGIVEGMARYASVLARHHAALLSAATVLGEVVYVSPRKPRARGRRLEPRREILKESDLAASIRLFTRGHAVSR